MSDRELTAVEAALVQTLVRVIVSAITETKAPITLPTRRRA